jgi:hypothetical protein
MRGSDVKLVLRNVAISQSSGRMPAGCLAIASASLVNVAGWLGSCAVRTEACSAPCTDRRATWHKLKLRGVESTGEERARKRQESRAHGKGCRQSRENPSELPKRGQAVRKRLRASSASAAR